MPEMPEVEIIRRGLKRHLLEKQIVNIEVFLPRLIKWPEADEFKSMVIGRKIIAANRRGKYLLLELDNGNTLVFLLRMTGRLLCVSPDDEQDAYRKIIFHLDDGSLLVYADTRTLGTVYALKPGETWRISGLNNLGPEPLSEEFTESYLAKILKKSSSKLKSFLLNQKYISGLGNIYADEALALAKIHPQRTGAGLTSIEVTSLYRAINEVIAAGIADGGTTFRDYRNGEGGRGHHQEHLHVYGRNGQACLDCGATIVKIEVGGRGTHFCPICQVLEGK